MQKTTDQILEEIFSATDVAFFATCDGDQPCVRPVNIALREGLTLWVASYAHWRKIEQLRRNPKLELAVMAPSGAHLRIVGVGRLREDPDKKRRVFEEFPLMRNYFDRVDDPEYALIEVVPERVEVKDAWDLEYREVELP